MRSGHVRLYVDVQCFLRRPESEKIYGFSDFTSSLNEMEEGIAPTDSRLRPDQRLMEQQDFDKANEEKVSSTLPVRILRLVLYTMYNMIIAEFLSVRQLISHRISLTHDCMIVCVCVCVCVCPYQGMQLHCKYNSTVHIHVLYVTRSPWYTCNVRNSI